MATPSKSPKRASKSPTPAKARGGGRAAPPPGTSHAHAHYEFGGPLGAVVLPLVLVGTVYFLQAAANAHYALTPSSLHELPEQLRGLPVRLPSARALVVTAAWFLFQVALERVLPGDVVEGTVLRDGKRLKYNINGHLAFWVSLLVVGHGWAPALDERWHLTGWSRLDLAWIYDNYWDLATSAALLSTALSLYLYAKSFARGALLARGGDTGNAVYDWFIGRELNPREGATFDWKEFCELRPGLIGWVVINAGCAAKQYQLTGAVSAPMLLINLFQGYYVWDALFSERAILTTMDITTDGFGFMLAFGDLAWVPFTYTLQARFLVERSSEAPPLFWVAVFAVNALGMFVFRGANGEKDQFRRDPSDPSVSHIEYIDTKRGTKLMVTGWWGLARKINYTGDWLMGLSWCLTTGFVTPVTYFYAIYFAVLLVHRAMRDDEACRAKYGAEDWARYKARVPYVFVPGVV